MVAFPTRRHWALFRFVRIWVRFGLLLNIGMYGGAQPTPDDDNYSRGVAYLHEGRLNEALPFLVKATALSPDSADAWKALGLTHLGLKHYAEAIDPLRHACERSSGEEDACYLAGRTLSLLARYDEAVEPLEKALRTAAQGQDQAKVNRAIALNLANLGNAVEAERHFHAAIRADRPATDAREDPRLDYGAFLIRQGRAGEALEPLKQTLATSPNSPAGNAETGRALLDLDRPAEALPYLQRAVAIDPQAWNVRMLLGKAYLRIGRSADGERELRKGREGWATANAGSSKVQ
jgi:tetratricopeptide (TPR) repeat protein